jgi:hypothetical protein
LIRVTHPRSLEVAVSRERRSCAGFDVLHDDDDLPDKPGVSDRAAAVARARDAGIRPSPLSNLFEPNGRGNLPSRNWLARPAFAPKPQRQVRRDPACLQRERGAATRHGEQADA